MPRGEPISFSIGIIGFGAIIYIFGSALIKNARTIPYEANNGTNQTSPIPVALMINHKLEQLCLYGYYTLCILGYMYLRTVPSRYDFGCEEDNTTVKRICYGTALYVASMLALVMVQMKHRNQDIVQQVIAIATE